MKLYNKIIFMIFLIFSGIVSAAIPNDFKITELKEYLEKEVVCIENMCGEINGVNILNKSKNNLKLEVKITALKTMYIKLPFSLYNIKFKTNNHLIYKNNDDFGVVVKKGNHSVVFDLDVKDVDILYFSFDKVYSDNIKVYKENGIAYLKIKEEKDLFEYKPSFIIKRNFKLTDVWSVKTEIIPVYNKSNEVVKIKLPLLDNEIVNSSADIKKGELEINVANKAIVINSYIPITNLLKFKNNFAIYPMVIQIENDSDWVVSGNKYPNLIINNQSNLNNVSEWSLFYKNSLDVEIKKVDNKIGNSTTISNYKVKTDINKDTYIVNHEILLKSSVKKDYKLNIGNSYEVVEITNNNISVSFNKNISIPIEIGDNNLNIKTKLNEKNYNKYEFKLINNDIKVKNVEYYLSVNDKYILWTSNGTDIYPTNQMYWYSVIILICIALLIKIKDLKLSSVEWGFLLFGLIQGSLLSLILFVVWIYVVNEGNSFFKIKTYKIISIIMGLLVTIIIMNNLKLNLISYPNQMFEGINTIKDYNGWQLYWYNQEIKNHPYVFYVSKYIYRGIVLLWAIWAAFKLYGIGKWVFEKTIKV